MRLHVGPRSFLLHQTISELERRLDPALHDGLGLGVLVVLRALPPRYVGLEVHDLLGLL